MTDPAKANHTSALQQRNNALARIREMPNTEHQQIATTLAETILRMASPVDPKIAFAAQALALAELMLMHTVPAAPAPLVAVPDKRVIVTNMAPSDE